MSYCTILTGVDGRPYRYYPTVAKALKAAKSYFKRHGAAIEVVWCNDLNNPKLWMAYVTPKEGVRLTEYYRVDGERKPELYYTIKPTREADGTLCDEHQAIWFGVWKCDGNPDNDQLYEGLDTRQQAEDWIEDHSLT